MSTESVITLVVGCFFEGGHSGRACVRCSKLRVNEGLICVREPSNPKDTNAVRLLTVTGEYVGYVRRAEAGIVARWMDDGRIVAAKIIEASRIYKRSYNHLGIIDHMTWPRAIVWTDESPQEEAEQKAQAPRSRRRQRERVE